MGGVGNRNNPASDSPPPPRRGRAHTPLTNVAAHTSPPVEKEKKKKKLNQGFEKHTVSLIIQASVGLNSLFSEEIYRLLI